MISSVDSRSGLLPSLLTVYLSLSLLWIFVQDLCNMYISGVFVLVIFDSLLKEFHGSNGSTLRE